MKKKSGLTSREMRLLLSRGFFNRRYIVRNTLAATVLVTFLVIAVGVSAVITGDAATGDEMLSVSEDKQIEELIVEEIKTNTTEEKKEELQVAEVTHDEDEEVIIGEAGVSAVDTNPVTTSKYDNRFIAIDTGINIREGASTDYDVIGYLETGMVGEFLGYEGDWSSIAVGDLVGYVNSQYILIGDLAVEFAERNSYDMDTLSYYEAVSYEENIEDYWDDTEDDDYSDDYEESYVEDTADDYEEDDYVDDADEEQAEDDNNNSGATLIETVDRDSIGFTDEEIALIAAVVALESGNECYEGQLAVANVVINRLNSGYWGNSIESVVYAQNQFEVVYTDAFESYLANGASGLSLQAALEAAGGTNNIGSYMSFRPTYFLNSMSFDDYTIIGNHIFF